MQAPTFDEVFLFLKQIFVAADLTAEIGIIMIIYLERMIAKTHITLHGINVFRALLGALMLASKVWDDQAVWNVDFKTIFVDLKLADLNQLERWWLGKVGFDISVQRGIYARYWFEIREVAEKLWGVRMSVLSSNMALARSHANMLKSNSKLATDKTKYDGASKTSLQVGNNSTRQSMNGGMESDNSKPSMQSLNTKSMSNMHPSHSKHYSVPKPQTEQHLQSVTLSTSSFSQSKIRENFTEQLSAPPTGSMLKVWENDADTKKKDRYSTGSYSTTPANGSIDNGPRLHNPVEKQASNTNVKKPSIYRDNTGSSAPTQITSAKVLPKPDDNGLKDTILNKLNTETNDFGWGGSNLRRAKSSDLYRPALPPASVL